MNTEKMTLKLGRDENATKDDVEWQAIAEER